MSKSNNQSNSLDNIEFVEDISQETAANCSGGAGYLNSSDPDVILHKDPNGMGDTLNVNAAIGDGLSNIGTNDGNGGGGNNGFNDQTSSITILRGTWQFYSDDNFNTSISTTEGLTNFDQQVTRPLGPGNYNLGANNDMITSAVRIG